MGFFSWKTQDTNRSIPSSWSKRKTFKVYMIDDKGHIWIEKNYEGYGIFEGKDFYELLAEMNGGSGRGFGIDLACGETPFKSPNLVEDLSEWEYIDEPPNDCEYQGYFY